MTDKPSRFDRKFDSAGDFDKARELIERMNAILAAKEAQIDRVRAALDLDGDWEAREHAIRAALGEPAAPRCIGYPKCDGNLVAEPHSEECPLYRSEPAATPEREQP